MSLVAKHQRGQLPSDAMLPFWSPHNRGFHFSSIHLGPSSFLLLPLSIFLPPHRAFSFTTLFIFPSVNITPPNCIHLPTGTSEIVVTVSSSLTLLLV